MIFSDEIDHAHVRKRLPNRRGATSFEEHNGIRFLGTYSKFADGSVGEIFVSNQKAGSHLTCASLTWAVAASWRCNLAARSLSNADGSPATLGAALDIISGRAR